MTPPVKVRTGQNGSFFTKSTVLEMMFCWMENLKMSVRALMATCPRCFRCMHETPSGPTADVGLFCSIACLIMFGVKVGGSQLWGASCVGFCLFCFVDVVMWESGKET